MRGTHRAITVRPLKPIAIAGVASERMASGGNAGWYHLPATAKAEIIFYT
jgi:hypothetical protein